MAVAEVFANLVLALFGLIGCTQGGRGQDPLVLLAEMLGISAEQLYREIGLFVMGNYHDISALDTGNKGLDYYVARAAAHQFHILLLEAACRAKGVQLMFWSSGQVGCTLFGLQGPLYSMVNNGRERIGLRGEPIIPYVDKVKSWNIPVAQQRNIAERPTPRQQRQPSVQAAIGTGLQSSHRVSEEPVRTPHTENQPRIADQAIHPSSRAYRYIIPVFVRKTSQRRTGNSRDSVDRDTTGRAPCMRVNTRQAPAYAEIERKFVCRLPHCGVPDKKFDTLSAWKKHASLARCHADTGLCTKCMRFLEVPFRMEAEDVRACVRSHKLGGCRRTHYELPELAELIEDESETSPNNGLWRMAEQAPLPDDQPQAGPSNEPDQAPQARRKRPRSWAEQMLEEFTKRARED